MLTAVSNKGILLQTNLLLFLIYLLERDAKFYCYDVPYKNIIVLIKRFIN